jgi:RHS repeat-associated protein
MLGNTLGVSDNGNFTKVNMTAFGETTATNHYPLTTNHFFTGKPYIGELGYAFLFRNYRPEQGKWQTADPLGYPDGWNNLAYVNNWVIGAVDPAGAAVYWTARDLNGSPVGNHHYVVFIPDSPNGSSDKTRDLGAGKQGWTSGGFGDKGKLVTRDNDESDLQATRELLDPVNYPPGSLADYDTEMHEIPRPPGMSDAEFIQKIQEAINDYQNNCPYDLADENCAAWVNSMLDRAGVPEDVRETIGEFNGVDWGEEDLIPSEFFE